MTFSTNWGRGADADEARRIFDAYVERGEDLIDTAVNYTDSECERLVGRLTASHRERLIVSTKSTMSRTPSDPNSEITGSTWSARWKPVCGIWNAFQNRPRPVSVQGSSTA
ncbi:hypothetical protein A5695_14915 [Mycobacterium sp. E1747]|nr:hypothetical protein A5695_14915 [Mycobacterium sp. E1747]